MKKIFTPIAKNLKENEAQINKELIDAQGPSVDIGGYYAPTEKLVYEIMRPSTILNNILLKLNPSIALQ